MKQDILEYMGQDVPISGGMGLSIDDPIVIEETNSSKYVKLEYLILDFLAHMRETKYKLENQEVLEKDGRMIDRLEIVWEDKGDSLYSFYFDITASYGHKSPK
jgi:hypothetical protein